MLVMVMVVGGVDVGGGGGGDDGGGGGGGGVEDGGGGGGGGGGVEVGVGSDVDVDWAASVKNPGMTRSPRSTSGPVVDISTKSQFLPGPYEMTPFSKTDRRRSLIFKICLYFVYCNNSSRIET